MNPKKVNLFIVGSAKCGTTSLANYLSSCENINLSKIKEPNHFSTVTNKKKGFFRSVSQTSAYLSLFDFSGNFKYWLDASTSYLWDKSSAKKIYDYNKESKIIVVIRDPVKRAISHHLNDLREGHVKESLEACLRKEIEMEKNGVINNLKWGDDYLYLSIGKYHEQIERYCKYFGNNLIVIEFDDMVNNWVDVRNKLSKFLDINLPVSDLANENSFSKPKNKLFKKVLSVGIFRILARNVVPARYRQKVHQSMMVKSAKPEVDRGTLELISKYYE